MKIKKAFTLVELLIVVAIIGVLAGLLFPAISGVMDIGPKSVSQNNGKAIALAWRTHGKPITKIDEYEWAKVLAERDGFNEAKMWILESDPKVQEKISMDEASMPLFVANENSGQWIVDPEFRSFPLSWAIANGTLTTGSKGDTPLIWSRGLKPDGYWDIDQGVFGDSGGHIVYASGSVEWHSSLRDENTQEGTLKVYGKTQRTFNIADAIKGGSSSILNQNL